MKIGVTPFTTFVNNNSNIETTFKINQTELEDLYDGDEFE